MVFFSCQYARAQIKGTQIRRKEERKQDFSEPRMCWGSDFVRGGGNLPATSQTSLFSTPDREALHHTLTMIGGGGPEKSSFRLSFQPALRLLESCVRSNGI